MDSQLEARANEQAISIEKRAGQSQRNENSLQNASQEKKGRLKEKAPRRTTKEGEHVVSLSV